MGEERGPDAAELAAQLRQLRAETYRRLAAAQPAEPAREPRGDRRPEPDVIPRARRAYRLATRHLLSRNLDAIDDLEQSLAELEAGFDRLRRTDAP